MHKNRNYIIINILTIALVLLIINPIVVSLEVENQTFPENMQNIPDFYGQGHRYNIQGWVYIHIEGEPYERGYQYGYLASAEIIDMIYRWSNFGHALKFMKVFVLKNQPGNYDKLSEKWWDMCRNRAVNYFLKQIPEEYKEEMIGMVDGINAKNEKIFGRDIDFQDILASQLVQEIWYSYKFVNKLFHPLRGLFSGVKEILTGEIKDDHPGHCSAFIATGDATTDGGIVVGHSTIFNRYIAERCNFILDVQPLEGHRFVMTCPPGSLWSQEDYYQNDQGIVITETELPQGPWKLKGIPKGVRSRKAIQYSDCIDDVIEILMDGNNGLIPNEWLIGDTKTGEIASVEQALFNTPIKRTYNGFYWSTNVPHDKKVKRELFGLIDLSKITSNTYYNTFDGGRDEKFKELNDECYGKIDTEIGKNFFSTYPICNGVTDGKITNSELMKKTGLMAFMGIPNGNTYVPTSEERDKFKGITELPPNGWVELYPSSSKPINLPKNNKLTSIKESKVVQKYETDHVGNMNYPYIKATGLSDFVFIGTDKGLHAIEKETGKIKWEQTIGKIASKPVIYKETVLAGCKDGGLYAFDKDTGKTEWKYEFPGTPHLSDVKKNCVYIGSGEKCYKFDISEKKVLWDFKTDDPITVSPNVDSGVVYFGSWDGKVYAIDSETGELKWTYETGWGIDTTPAVSDDIVYVGSNDNNFYAINKETGETEWYFTCRSAIHSSPVVYGEYVFFGSDDGRLYALDKTNGEVAWDFAPNYVINNNDVNNYVSTPIISDPVISDGIIYIDAMGTVYALDTQTTEIIEKQVEKPEGIDSVLLIIILLFGILLTLIICRFHIRRKYGKY